MEKNVKNFKDFLNEKYAIEIETVNEEADPHQKDLRRVIKTMEKNRDAFVAKLKKERKNLTKAQIADIEERIKNLNSWIADNKADLKVKSGKKMVKKVKDPITGFDRWINSAHY